MADAAADPNPSTSTTRQWTSWVGRHMHEELTADQRDMIRELRSRCSDVLPATDVLPTCTDTYLLRYLRARQFKIGKAEEMLRAAIATRREQDVKWEAFSKEYRADPEKDVYPFPEAYLRYSALQWFGEDNDGSPNLWLFFGKADVPGMHKTFTTAQLIRLIQYEHEVHWKKRLDKEKKTGVECEQINMIYDMQGMSLGKILYKPSMAARKIATAYMQDIHPEMAKRIFVINAPTTFTVVWGVMKHLLDRRVQKKVTVLGGNFLSTLRQHISNDNILSYVGGGAETPEFAEDRYTITNDGQVTKLDNVPFLNYGEIPDSFHKSGLEIDNATTVNVGRGGSEQIEVKVEVAGSAITVEFQSQDHDIGYGLYYKGNVHSKTKVHAGDMEEVVGSQRYDSHLCPVESNYTAEKVGIYVVRFDNTYSYLRGKTVFYTTTVQPPAASDAARDLE